MNSSCLWRQVLNILMSALRYVNGSFKFVYVRKEKRRRWFLPPAKYRLSRRCVNSHKILHARVLELYQWKKKSSVPCLVTTLLKPVSSNFSNCLIKRCLLVAISVEWPWYQSQVQKLTVFKEDKMLRLTKQEWGPWTNLFIFFI